LQQKIVCGSAAGHALPFVVVVTKAEVFLEVFLRILQIVVGLTPYRVALAVSLSLY
jgi:hypothetical protein